MSPARERGRPRSRPDGTGSTLRDEILLAAASLLEESADERSVTLRAVARRTGIAAPSIYHHFANLGQIIGEVVRSAQDSFDEAVRSAISDAPSPSDRLTSGFRAYLAFAREHPGSYRVLMARSNPSELADVSLLAQDNFALLQRLVRQAAPHVTAEGAVQRARIAWLYLHSAAVLPPINPRFDWPDDATLVADILQLILA